MTTAERANIKYNEGDEVYAVTLRNMPGKCRVIKVGPRPADGKVGADWATVTYDIECEANGNKAIALLASDIKPARQRA